MEELDAGASCVRPMIADKHGEVYATHSTRTSDCLEITVYNGQRSFGVDDPDDGASSRQYSSSSSSSESKGGGA